MARATCRFIASSSEASGSRLSLFKTAWRTCVAPTRWAKLIAEPFPLSFRK